MPSPTQPASPSTNAGSATENGTSNADTQASAETPKFFFQEKYAKLGVKGNFMPLAAQPTNVELADWLAHQSESCEVFPFYVFYGLTSLCHSCGELPYPLDRYWGYF